VPSIGPKDIFRSTDNGATWTTAHTEAMDGITHFHAVTKQEAVGRWIAIAGDGAKAKVLYSDDDGLTWGTLIDSPSPLQPCDLLDYGDPTKLLAGSDESFGVYTFDVVTKKLEVKFDQVDMRSTRGYFWRLAQIDGL
jgi:photosystem II stability/assembly factor-like uncharacterized protein